MEETMSGNAQRKKQQRQQGDGAGRATPRTSWRGVPDDTLGIIAEMAGPFACPTLSEARALRAVLPSALTALKVESPRQGNALRPLATALLGEDGWGANAARVTHALATQDALSEIAVTFASNTVAAAAISEAVKANNACWKALKLLNSWSNAPTALLESLQHNHELHTLHVAACLSLADSVAIGKALRAQRCGLRELSVSSQVRGEGVVWCLVEGVKQSRTLRRLYLDLSGIKGGDDFKLLMATLSGAERGQQVPLEVLVVKSRGWFEGSVAWFSVKALARDDKLHELHVESSDLSNAACNALAVALASRSSALSKLCISSNDELTNSNCAVLVGALTTSGALRELDLSKCGVDIATRQALAVALAVNGTALRTLNLSDNPNIGDAGGAAVCQALATNSTLRTLGLAACGVGIATCRALAAALASETFALRTLDLSNNVDLDDDAGVAVCEALATNSTLRNLDLGECGVGLATCRALGDALSFEHSALLTLDLRKNCISDDCGAALCQALAKNRTLRRLNLSNSSVSIVTCRALVEALGPEIFVLSRLSLSANPNMRVAGGKGQAEGDTATTATPLRIHLVGCSVCVDLHNHIDKVLSTRR